MFCVKKKEQLLLTFPNVYLKLSKYYNQDEKHKTKHYITATTLTIMTTTPTVVIFALLI